MKPVNFVRLYQDFYKEVSSCTACIGIAQYCPDHHKKRLSIMDLQEKNRIR